ncbi:hypothetical protein [Pedobacter sp. FW305-3-2-15-E-R2A2]|jgi:hypothetical protein|uniref:hypothetical protein n=1 Tax=Pedobacter sp. FW305-3-2-15-E-R2A2 TaxID=3140251 RepID=UPI00313FE9D2
MVAVFKTNAEFPTDAMKIIELLSGAYQGFTVSVDKEDEDRILRVEGDVFDVEDIIILLQYNGFNCVYLPFDW